MASNDVHAEIRVWLADRLKTKGVSQAELARIMSLPPSAVSRILKGQRQISISELIDVAAALDVSLYEIDALFHSIKKDQSKKFWNEGVKEENVAIPNFYDGNNPRYPEDKLVIVRPYSDRIAEWKIPEIAFGDFKTDALLARWLDISDDAMAPTLKKGDTVFLSFHPVNPLRNGLYAIQNEGEYNDLFVRRLEFRLADREVRAKVICDNPDFADLEQPLTAINIIAICIAHFQPLPR